MCIQGHLETQASQDFGKESVGIGQTQQQLEAWSHVLFRLPRTLPHTLPLTLPHILPRSESGQKVTVDELVQDPHFVQIVLSNKCITGPEAKTIALTTGGRMPGSVQDRVSRRAANIILHADAKYYEDDWSKIPAWGRDFVAKNKGSHFHYEKDKNGRYIFMPRTLPRTLPHPLSPDSSAVFSVCKPHWMWHCVSV